MIAPLTYFKQVTEEAQRVVWPNPRMVGLHTAIVVISMVVIIAVVSGIDYIFLTAIRYLLFKGQL